MRQNEVRTTEHHHTPSSKARQPGRHKATRYPEGGTSIRTGPGRHKGPTTGGAGSNNRQGRGADNSQAKDKRKETPPHTKRRTTAKEKTPAKAQAEAPAQQKHQTKKQGGQAREEAKHKTKDKRRQGEHSPNQARAKTAKQERGPGGDRTPRRPAKRPPPHRSRREQITTRCPGTKSTGDQNGKELCSCVSRQQIEILQKNGPNNCSNNCFHHDPRLQMPLLAFFPSNATWLSPGRLSIRTASCILQIPRINAVATSS